MSRASGSAEAKPPVKICPTCGERFGMDALFCPNDGSPLAMAQGDSSGPQPGTPDPYLGKELVGHIEIRQLVGVGAMGRVYRAFQKGIDRDVAVKILHRELSANQQLVARFHREAKVASRLLHPNVVGVHLAGQLPDGAMYIVMEYLDGLSLQSALAASGGAFDLPRALHVAFQLCDATGEAHATGVVHRDLKPENVMLVRRGADPDFVKVLDFGIARLNWGEQSMATAAGLIFGTARYISPEGAQGEAVGPTGDVYAAATLVYQMLAGRTPFEGEQAVALLVQQIHDQPPPLRSIPRASYVPEPIAQVVMANLAKDPLQREPDGRALGHALLDAAKLSGLSPEDLVPRPLMRSSRPPVHLPALHRTDKQLQLVSPVPSPVPQAPPAAPSAPATDPLRVDTTLDDIEPPPEIKNHPYGQTQAVAPIDVPTPAAKTPSAPPMRGSMPSMDDPSLVDDLPAPIVPDSPETARRRARSRTIFLFVACFLVGVIGAAALAYHFGYVGPAAADKTTLASYQERARDAFHKQHWDSPPGENVRDVTNEGLAKYPRDPKLLEIRAITTDELVKDAVAEKYLGHNDDAARMARLAHELDPTDVAADRLAAEYSEQGQAATDAGLARDAEAPALAHTSKGGNTVAPIAGAHGVIELSPGKPQINQPVTISVRLFVGSGSPKALPEGVLLTVSGPDVPPGTVIPSLPDGPSLVSARLMFQEPGRFELVFTGKVDGTPVRITRTVVLDAPGAPSTGGPDGGKWL